VANTLKLFRQGAVGFIDWLDGWRLSQRKSGDLQCLPRNEAVTAPTRLAAAQIENPALNLVARNPSRRGEILRNTADPLNHRAFRRRYFFRCDFSATIIKLVEFSGLPLE